MSCFRLQPPFFFTGSIRSVTTLLILLLLIAAFWALRTVQQLFALRSSLSHSTNYLSFAIYIRKKQFRGLNCAFVFSQFPCLIPIPSSPCFQIPIWDFKKIDFRKYPFGFFSIDLLLFLCFLFQLIGLCFFSHCYNLRLWQKVYFPILGSPVFALF